MPVGAKLEWESWKGIDTNLKWNHMGIRLDPLILLSNGGIRKCFVDRIGASICEEMQ